MLKIVSLQKAILKNVKLLCISSKVYKKLNIQDQIQFIQLQYKLTIVKTKLLPTRNIYYNVSKYLEITSDQSKTSIEPLRSQEYIRFLAF